MNWLPTWTPATLLLWGIFFLLAQNRKERISSTTPQAHKPNFASETNAEIPAIGLFSDKDLDRINSVIIEAYSQYDLGNRKIAMASIAKIALEGVASPLSTYSWWALETGQHQEAVYLYNLARPGLENKNEPYEIMNCDSNNALHKLALGGSNQEGLSVWQANIEIWEKDPSLEFPSESFFYPALIADREGNKDLRDSILIAIDSKLLNDLRSMFLSEVAISEGWFKDWCGDAIIILNQILDAE